MEAREMQKLEQKRYTYADYAEWETDERYELINGVPIVMDSPNYKHQNAVGELHFQVKSFLQGKPCKVVLSPFDVRLNADKKDDIVVQPDLLVVCDKKKLANGKNCVGAPDMVIEIISPSNRRHDCVTKREIYEKHGVREYWIIDPDAFAVYIYRLENGVFKSEVHLYPEKLPVGVVDGLELDFTDVFPQEDNTEEHSQKPFA